MSELIRISFDLVKFYYYQRGKYLEKISVVGDNKEISCSFSVTA